MSFDKMTESFELQLRLLNLAARKVCSPAARRLDPELSSVPAARVQAEVNVLQLLGALDDNGLTDVGGEMEPFVTCDSYPISPRLAKVILEGAKLGLTDPVIDIVSLLATKHRLYRASGPNSRRSFQHIDDRSDLPALLEADRQMQFAVRNGGDNELKALCASKSLGHTTWYWAHAYRRQLRRVARRLRMPMQENTITEEMLITLFLHGFGDRLLRPTSTSDRCGRKWIWATGIKSGPGVARSSAIHKFAKQGGQLAFGISLTTFPPDFSHFDIAALCSPEQVAKVFGKRVTVQHIGTHPRGGQMMCEQRWYLDGDCFLRREVVAPIGNTEPAALCDAK